MGAQSSGSAGIAGVLAIAVQQPSAETCNLFWLWLCEERLCGFCTTPEKKWHDTRWKKHYTQSVKKHSDKPEHRLAWEAPRILAPFTRPVISNRRWQDNFPKLTSCSVKPPSDHLCVLKEEDQAERIWVGNFKTCSCFWAREKICIIHWGFDGFSHVLPDSGFC